MEEAECGVLAEPRRDHQHARNADGVGEENQWSHAQQQGEPSAQRSSGDVHPERGEGQKGNQRAHSRARLGHNEGPVVRLQHQPIADDTQAERMSQGSRADCCHVLHGEADGVEQAAIDAQAKGKEAKWECK